MSDKEQQSTILENQFHVLSEQVSKLNNLVSRVAGFNSRMRGTKLDENTQEPDVPNTFLSKQDNKLHELVIALEDLEEEVKCIETYL